MQAFRQSGRRRPRQLQSATMRPKLLAVLAALLLGSVRVSAGDVAGVYLVDFHSHTERGPHLHDDGKEPLDKQAERLKRVGFDVVFHTPHSDRNEDPALWKRQREHELKGDWALKRYLGEELTVEKGPNWAVLMARPNNDHLGVVGHDEWITHALPLKAACEWAHAMGGTVTVNHPGPGPSLWEAGYWERPGLRDRIDAIEVCNGRLMHSVPLHSFQLYLRAVSYRGWGLKIAALGGTDSHSARESENAQVGTLVMAPEPTERAIVEAVRQRRTFVLYRLLDLRLRCDQLGKVIRSSDVALELVCSRKVSRISLLREGTEIKSWVNADRAVFKERISDNAAYAWRIVDGKSGKRRAFSSAIWYEASPPALPDLLVDTKASRVRGRNLTLAVRNVGSVPARDVIVEAWTGSPWKDGTRVARHTFAVVAEGGKQEIVLKLAKRPVGRVFVRVDPDSYALDRNDDAIAELDERNNCALLPNTGR